MQIVVLRRFILKKTLRGGEFRFLFLKHIVAGIFLYRNRPEKCQ